MKIEIITIFSDENYNNDNSDSSERPSINAGVKNSQKIIMIMWHLEITTMSVIVIALGVLKKRIDKHINQI